MSSALAGPPAATTPEERAARGKAARAQTPRSGHADWTPRADRPSALEMLLAEDEGRLPELVPIRHGRMLTSPFAYFRGSAGVMAGDLADTPVSGLRVQLCGDAHLTNFGAFAAPDRRIVFDVNDFDETAPGPWEWDVKRLAASFALAGRHRGVDDAERARITRRVVRAYRTSMRSFAAMQTLDVWYARLEIEAILDRLRPERRKAVERNLDKAQRKNSLRAMEVLTHRVDGRPRIAPDPPLVVPIEDLVDAADGRDLTDAMKELLGRYRATLPRDRGHLLDQFHFAHMARKVVGVGSVGTRAWILLLLGRDDADPLFLQVKEAGPSVVEPVAGPAGFDHHGQRVVEGQRLMQAASDIFLGWLRAEGVDGIERDFYVRQLWDGKRSADVDRMEPDQFASYADACGWTLARAHARSGDRIAIAAYLGGGDRFDRAVAEFAERYADRTERDHDALVSAARSGVIDAESED
jgi:uncharacterized protein (DUF2252 family)